MSIPDNLPETGVITLIAEFSARPGEAETVDALLGEYGKQVRFEDGNVLFDCCRRLDNPDRFVVYEIYVDREAFDVHLAADYGATFNDKLKDLIVEPNSVLTFLTPIGNR